MTTLAQNQTFEQTAIVASNSLSILDNTISVVDGRYSLNDLHKASGNNEKHKPANFLRNDQTQALIAEIDQCENSHSENKQFSEMSSAVKVINGGLKRGTYVCRELVYAYAMWISAKFHLMVIRAFDAMYAQPANSTQEELRFQIPDIIHELVSQGVAAKGTIYNRLYRRFNVSSYKDIPLEQCQAAINYLSRMASTNSQKARVTINDGEHYFVVKDGVVLWEKVLKPHCNDLPSNALKNPALMLEHIREVVGEFIGKDALIEHKPLENENNLVMLNRDTTNKVMDYFSALRYEIKRLDGNLPTYPEFDKNTLVRAVVTSMVDSSQMLLSFSSSTGQPYISFIPQDSMVINSENIVQVIGDSERIPKKLLPDIAKAAVNRLSGS